MMDQKPIAALRMKEGMMKKIQIVEDDKTLSNGIVMTLGGLETEFIQDGTVLDAKRDFELQGDAVNAIILDINLPDASGYDYLKWVRARSKVPVLILTANDLEMDEVMGLEMGADDYITKPFSLAVLRARMHVLLRRGCEAQAGEAAGGTVVIGPYCFDFEAAEYKKGNEKIALSLTEQKLLRLLVSNRGNLLMRQMLYDRLWGNEGSFVDENALSVTVNRLRSKLRDGEDGVTYIQTVYGQGYIWKEEQR